ncbi:Glutathione S-transferase Phi class [Zostera marina]|uniref:glutathione transferase n=1 Tax=Zostera marina TaxID=29655 RepID=A0A0K9Q424_ZOSMR|nr:Glutathione S-transferase Phi class [Zostera marina]
MASINVFGSPTSTEVARVLACLFEKNVEFQLIRVDGFKGAHRKKDYLKQQSTGQALTYEEGKTTLVDSRAICRHVSKKFAEQGNKDLLGIGTLERASIEQWLQTEENSFNVPSSNLVFHLAVSPDMRDKHDDAVIEDSKNKLLSVLEFYERRLEETSFLAGDNFTLADLSHLPNAQCIMNTDYASMFMSKKKVREWWEKISSRPSWRRVVAMQKVSMPVAN